MSDAIEIDDYRWLTSEVAEEWIAVAAERLIPLHRRAAKLRQFLTAARAHLVLEQADLRTRATCKFRPCDTLFFTPVGLQQATDQWIADYKARRFPAQATVIDLCCGIGGDMLRIGATSQVTGYDRDPISALFACENVRRTHGDAVAAQPVARADAEAADLRNTSAWHIDPDRRDGGRRTTDLAQMSPSLEVIERLLATNDNAAIKLAPATPPPAGWHARAELEWISRGRECRQLVAWHGGLARSPGRRRATILGSSGDVLSQIDGTQRPFPSPAGRIEDFISEPDPAVLAAGLAGHLAEAKGILPIAADIPYFTSGRAVDDPAMASFRVECVLPYDEKRVASALRAEGIGTIEIKHRGVRIEPHRLRRKLRLTGDRSGVLIISPHNGRNVAIVATRAARDDTIVGD